MTTPRNKVSVFGVIVSGVTKDDAVERYLEAINGNSVSLYTSQSSNFGILSESGTHLYNPITSSADMEESEDNVTTMLSSYSSGDEDLQAHYSVCTDGCGAHIVASDNFITQFCPVCASELDDLEDQEALTGDDDLDGDGIDDDLEEFDTSYEAEASLSDSEIDDFAIIAGISFSEADDGDGASTEKGAEPAPAAAPAEPEEDDEEEEPEEDDEEEEEEPEAKEKPEAAATPAPVTPAAAAPAKPQTAAASDAEIDEFALIAGLDFSFDDASESSITDEEIDEFAMMAGISLSDDMADPEVDDEEDDEDQGDFAPDDGDEEPEDDEDEEEVAEDNESESSMSDDEIDDFALIAGINFEDEISESGDDEEEVSQSGDEGDDEEEVSESGVEISDAELVAVASTKEEAIAAYAEICVSGAVTKHKATVSGVTFYSASSDAEIMFDPQYGDPNLESEDVIISTSSMGDEDTVAAHYFVCSSSDCGAHIVSSSESIEHCPACASGVQEPVAVADAEDGDCDSDDSEGDEDFDLGSIDDVDGEDDGDDSNEQALSRALSFVAGDKDVSTAKLNVAYCGAVDGLKSWIAFYNGQPIARATSESAVKHRAIFEEPAYANAVATGAEHLGVAKILDEMGFEAVMSSIAMSNSLKNVVNKHFKGKMDEITAKYEAEKEVANADYREALMAALSTAAVGINRGFFKGYNNPVKAALQSTLSAAGVRSSESLLDDVFKSHADDYHKALFEKALEIVGKPTEIQNEIAVAVSNTNYMSDGNKSMSHVEDRLSQIGNGNVQQVEQIKQPKQQAVASNVTQLDVSKIKSVVAGLGRR